jgi:hypothetical protein
MAVNDDFDLLGFLGPQRKDDELKKATQNPEESDRMVAWRELGFACDGDYDIPQFSCSRR